MPPNIKCDPECFSSVNTHFLANQEQTLNMYVLEMFREHSWIQKLLAR